MTPQSHFMINVPIKPGHREELAALLDSMNEAPGMAMPHNALIPFWQFRQLHMARFTILEANTNGDIAAHGIAPTFWPPSLCFLGDIDGDPDLFLAELVIRAEPGLHRIFTHCLGFVPEQIGLLDWLQQHRHKPAANYVNWQGRTVLQIEEESALHRYMASRARELSAANPRTGPREIWRQLQQSKEQEVQGRRLKLTPPAATPTGWCMLQLLHLIGVPLMLVLLSPLFLVATPFYLYRLRQLEQNDPQNELRAEDSHLQELVQQEDIDVTNHFNVFGQIKPGRLRLLTIRLGLLLLNYASRHVYRRGHLTRIQSIHFARWVLMDNARRVFFASNYDGSADSYMDDFINKVAWGLNLVFSNGVGYPRTRWLLKDGARYEENYKRTLRRNQLPTASWYKAYPGVTAFEMARNSRVRACLEDDNPDEKEIRACLELL